MSLSTSDFGQLVGLADRQPCTWVMLLLVSSSASRAEYQIHFRTNSSSKQPYTRLMSSCDHRQSWIQARAPVSVSLSAEKKLFGFTARAFHSWGLQNGFNNLKFGTNCTAIWIQSGCQRTSVAETVIVNTRPAFLVMEWVNFQMWHRGWLKLCQKIALMTGLFFPFHPVNLLNMTVRFNTHRTEKMLVMKSRLLSLSKHEESANSYKKKSISKVECVNCCPTCLSWKAALVGCMKCVLTVLKHNAEKICCTEKTFGASR